jgi:hypothetical protein
MEGYLKAIIGAGFGWLVSFLTVLAFDTNFQAIHLIPVIAFAYAAYTSNF